MVSGIPENTEWEIFIFVFRIDPPGPGYFLQPQPARVVSGGNWTSQAQYGAFNTPAGEGQTIEVLAGIVAPDASYNDTRLRALPPNFYLSNLGDIQGLIALSEPVSLQTE
jgi:hypothetical protein